MGPSQGHVKLNIQNETNQNVNNKVEKKEYTSQREKTFKLFEMIRNSEIGGDKFYLGPYGYKRSEF